MREMICHGDADTIRESMRDFANRGRAMDRRAFLASVTATAAAGVPKIDAQEERPIPIIDTHIHLFDPNRPQGAPYTGPRAGGTPPVAALPSRDRRLTMPLGVVGEIEVEASPWIEDNLWVLEVAQADTIMVGTVGNLEPDKPEFPEYLERYHKNPLFRGIRYGNLWGRDFTKQSENPAFISGLRRLAQAGLVLDTANPRITLLEAVVRITDRNLRALIVHDEVGRSCRPAVRERQGILARQESRHLVSLGARPDGARKQDCEEEGQ